MSGMTPYPAIMPGATPIAGKGSKQQDLISPHSGVMSTIAGGEPLARMMGHYGKGHSMIRDASGGLNKGHVRQGGLGPGKLSAPGTAANYSMTNADTE